MTLILDFKVDSFHFIFGYSQLLKKLTRKIQFPICLPQISELSIFITHMTLNLDFKEGSFTIIFGYGKL